MKSVANRHPLSILDWYEKKFEIADGPIAAAGSCFAQHIGRHLKTSGFSYVDTEPSPHWMPAEAAPKFGYGIYSARFGNIYSPRQLLQLMDRALGVRQDDEIWRFRGGYVDPLRPTIEPPLETPEQVDVSRRLHLKNVALMFRLAKTFIFTLGLTETWINKDTGTAYPLCPGTNGGEFNPHKHELVNFDHQQIVSDLDAFISKFRANRPDGQIILTVSPVALMATATGGNVVVSSSYSKAVLRAAAGHLAGKHEFVDYFPSYEIIASPPMRSMFFEPDMREVNPYGISHVMEQFFSQHRPSKAHGFALAKNEPKVCRADAICDEILLEIMETQ
ncbi:GSCFA domain-containing protein [Prosthecodimorpha staleyi]|uniref:GSCFA domain-containing protein n=1 Tax=Prosthecodimorpha staleyi TaxID=2840188 RepID=A0A947D8N5_9HYPH|nr:GSCFA domain-containing protein [Prosthecodimorpha staleyi]MBT9293160.1 GSCFA domain-containing protein [Prosthecodimorpha staleyi]